MVARLDIHMANQRQNKTTGSPSSDPKFSFKCGKPLRALGGVSDAIASTDVEVGKLIMSSRFNAVMPK